MNSKFKLFKNKKINLILSIIFCLIFLSLNFETGSTSIQGSLKQFDLPTEVTYKDGFVKSINGTGFSNINGIKATEDGGYVIVGSFSGDVDFNNDDIIDATALGELDGFIAKYDSKGILEWNKCYANYANDELLNVEVYSDGKYLVTGYISDNKKEGFIAKLDINGEQIWNKKFRGEFDNQVQDAKILDNGDIALIIKYNGKDVFLQDENDPSYVPYVGIKNPFIKKGKIYILNENGEYKASNSFDTDANLDLNSIIETKNGIVVSVNYFNNLYFNNMFEKTNMDEQEVENIEEIELKSKGDQDAALIAFSLDGKYQWKLEFGNKKEEQFSKINVDNEGNIIIAASYGQDVTIGHDALPTKSSTCSSSCAIKVNPDGEYIGNVNFGMSTDFESYDSKLTAIASTKDNGMILGGTFYGFIDVDKDEKTDFTARGEKYYDTLLVKVNDKFQVEWAKNYSGLNSESISSVAQLKNEEIVAVGNFNSDKIFTGNDDNVNDAILTKKGYDNAFMIMYSNDVDYQIHYFYDGVEDKSKIEKLSGKINQEVTEYPDKNILGYKLDRTENLPLKLSANENENILNIYYTYDPKQKKNISYSVEYYKDNELQDKDTKVIEKEIHVLDEETLKFDKTLVNDNEKYNGYKLERVEPDNIPEKVNNGDVIKVYYVKIPKKIIGYSIEYYIDNELQEDDTINVQEEVLETHNNEIKVDKTRINTTNRYCDKTFVKTEPEVIPDIINDGDVIKVFYKTTKGKINIEYKDKETDLKIAEDTYIEKNIGENYETKPIAIEGYKVVEEPKNSKGILDSANILVTYYYEKVAKVVVNYVDINTGNMIDSKVIDGEKDKYYYTIPKNFDKYVLLEKDKDGNDLLPQNSEGYMKSGTIEVNYYYNEVSEGIIEKHIDKNTGELLDNDVYTGNRGDSYNTTNKTFKGYDLQVDENGNSIYPENASGIIDGTGVIEVNYYYVRKTKVIVRYIDKITNKEIKVDNLDSSEIIEGHEGDPYETKAKDFEDYKLCEMPVNKIGFMTFNKVNGNNDNTTEVNYYYVPKEQTVLVRHIDYKNQEVLDIDSIEGKEGNQYQTNSKQFEGYDLLEKDEKGNSLLPENKDGIITDSLIKVNYYYIRKANVEVKYLDEDTEKEIAEPEIINGHEDDEYLTEGKEIDGYRLSKKPDNSQGTMKVDRSGNEVNVTTEVKYYYKKLPKNSVITVSYIDKNTNKILNKEELVVEQGKSYKTDSKIFEGYDLLEKDEKGNNLLPENAEGIAKDNKIEVNYYYVRQMKIKVQYINEETNKFIEDELVISSHEGESYEVKRKDIKDYQLDKDKLPNNEKGIMKVVQDKEGNDITEIIVKYYYKQIPKKSTITVSYIDKNTNNEIEKEEIEVELGKEYNIKNKDIEGYDLLEKDEKGNSLLPENNKGIAKEEKIDVKYYYVRQMKIQIQYIDKESNKRIAEDVVLEKHEGDSYEIKRKEFNNYELDKDKLPNNEKGTLKVVKDEKGNEITKIVVRYYYKKNINSNNSNSESKPQPKPQPQPQPQPNNTNNNQSTMVPSTGDTIVYIVTTVMVVVVILNICVQLFVIIRNKKNK